jgi:A/G-specific adenine glycosylase
MVCLPGEPKCLECPVIRFCKARGAQSKSATTVRKTASVSYAVTRQNGSVWLVQRPADAGLMAGMWELPELYLVDGTKPVARLKHAILNTGYDVKVYERSESSGKGRWASRAALARLPLTGLARKILQQVALL